MYWYIRSYNVRLHIAIYLPVVVWCDMLGNIQWWEDSLRRDPPPGAPTSAGDRLQDGKATQCCLHWWSVSILCTTRVTLYSLCSQVWRSDELLGEEPRGETSLLWASEQVIGLFGHDGRLLWLQREQCLNQAGICMLIRSDDQALTKYNNNYN